MKEYCEQIISLLNQVEEFDWSKTFSNLINSHYENEGELARKILKLYGGMGSFNDLVLFKNGILLRDENDKLEILRKKLYNNIEKFLSN